MPEPVQNVMYLFSQEVKKILGEDLSKVIVYGSYARGDFDENSDVDVMILTSLAENEIKPVEYKLYDVAFDFLMEYGVDISVIVKNEEHFKYWLGALPFYDNVEREGVVIMDNRKRDLSNYRLSQAEDSIKVAQMSFDNGLYKDSINCLYYAVFYAVKAVLALKEVSQMDME